MAFDPERYNPEWPMLRELISHRDRNRCKRCRAPHLLKIWRLRTGGWSLAMGQNRPGNAVKILLCVCTVAHLDWNCKNDDPKNLAFLCQKCHLDHDRPQHMYKKLVSKLRRSGQRELFPAKRPKPGRLRSLE